MVAKHKPSPNGGFYYDNELWNSDAYQSLPKSARNLFHCFLNELRWKGRGTYRVFTNNGELSYTEVQFGQLYGSGSTYLEARNRLIICGLIKQTYRGGMCRGDLATYKILCVKGVTLKDQRWKRYPTEQWTNDIPKHKKQLVGKRTQWKKGQCGRNTKATL